MNLRNKYEVILFDADDTLFDFKRSQDYAFQNVFEKFGFTGDLGGFLKDYGDISHVLWSLLEQGKLSLTELGTERFRRLFVKNDIGVNPEIFNNEYLHFLGKQPHLIDGAHELCKRLHEYRLAIITNGFAAVQIARLNRSPLRSFFKEIIISEQVGSQKPAKHIFDVACSTLHVNDPGKVLIVGDSLTSDIQGGTNYGMDTCWFNPDAKENHIGIQPTYEIKQLTDLLTILDVG